MLIKVLIYVESRLVETNRFEKKNSLGVRPWVLFIEKFILSHFTIEHLINKMIKDVSLS